MLSNQHLWQLRDCIECSLENFELKLAGAAAATRPGFFMIDNILYPDVRNQRSSEYTDPIVAWSKEVASTVRVLAARACTLCVCACTHATAAAAAASNAWWLPDAGRHVPTHGCSPG